jgi:ATP-binding cassette subfamily B protein
MKDEQKSTNQKNTQPPAMGFGGRPGGMGGVIAKPKDFKNAMKSLLNYIKPFWFAMVVVTLFSIISTIFTVVSPKILGNVTNEIVDSYINMSIYDQIVTNLPQGIKIPSGTTAGTFISKMPQTLIEKIPSDRLEKFKSIDLSIRPQINFDSIGKLVLLLIGLYLLSTVFSYIQGWIMTNITQKITYKLRNEISQKINKVPLSYFDSRSFGDVLSRITNDVDTISQSLNQSLTQIITSITSIIGILIMMLSISWQMTIIALVALPVSIGIIGFIISKSQIHFKQQQEHLGKINGHTEEMYSGHNIIKVFNAQKKSIEKFNKINESLYSSSWKSQFLSGLMFPIMNFIGNLDYVGVAIAGGYLAIKGTVNIGDIQAFIQYVNQFNQPIIQTANIANVLQSTAAASERVFEFLNEKEEIEDIKNNISIDKLEGSVEFENVLFGYSPDKMIIKGLNLKIKPGQRVAIVGPTGAGKTTIVNLLMRFYDVNSGSIKIDGIDIREFKRSDLRKLFGMVLQDTWLFNASIKDNIAYGKLNATEEEIINAAKATYVDHVVTSLPNGYNMIINEEAENISQGEKQLLTIARAMLANPPMLILDEATSSVDTRTEVLIQKAMDKLMHGRTSFVIAHRLSTIRDADLILVMRDGNIVEQGTHEQLLKQNGFYATMYNSQFSEEQ